MRTFKFIKHCLLFALVLVAATACERRPLVELNERGNMKVEFNVDWSRFNAPVPEKMTFICYPKDGGSPITKVGYNPYKLTTVLPSGDYKVLVINDEMEDFDCYSFVTTPEFGVSLVEGKEPLPLGVDMVEVTVPEPDLNVDEDGTVTETGKVVVAPTLHPKNILWTGYVKFGVTGYRYVKSLSGSLSGLAATSINDDKTIAQDLENWTGDNENEKFVTRFNCLGLPGNHSFAPEENMLSLDFTLIDDSSDKTEVPVGHLIQVDSVSRTLSIDISMLEIILSLGQQMEGGYDIEVEPWEEEK